MKHCPPRSQDPGAAGASARPDPRGAPAEPLLRAETARVAAEETQQKRSEELHKGTHSTRLANEIIALLASYPILPADAELVLPSVDVQSNRAGDRVPARSFLSLKAAFETARPNGVPPKEVFDLIEWLSKSLARAVVCYEASAEIRDRAIRRATAIAESKRHW